MPEGAAQLALAILLDYLDDPKRALELYQDFKMRVIAQLVVGENWALTGLQVGQEVAYIEAKKEGFRRDWNAREGVAQRYCEAPGCWAYMGTMLRSAFEEARRNCDDHRGYGKDRS